MPNYNLVIGSQFEPFSFERYLQPSMVYDKAYTDTENAMVDLQNKSDFFKNIADKNTASKSYNIYNNYSSQLGDLVNQLGSSGLSPQLRQGLMNMKKRYQGEIGALETAYKIKAADIQRQQSVQDKSGGKTVFSQDAVSRSLDDYLNGQPLDYRQANLDTVYAQAAKEAQALSARHVEYNNNGTAFGGQYLTSTKKTGISPQQLQAWQEGKIKLPELDNLITNIAGETGIDQYNEPERKKITDAILSGINSGVLYNEDQQKLDNWRAKMAEQDKYDQRRFSREHPNSTEGQVNDFSSQYIETVPRLTKDEHNKKYQKDLDSVETIRKQGLRASADNGAFKNKVGLLKAGTQGGLAMIAGNNKGRLQELAKDYGVTVHYSKSTGKASESDLNRLQNAIKKDRQMSSYYDMVYAPKITKTAMSQAMAITGQTGDAILANSNSDRPNVFVKLNSDGSKGKALSREDTDKILSSMKEGNGTYRYRPGFGFQMTVYKDKGSSSKTPEAIQVWANPVLFSGGNRTFEEAVTNENNYYKNKNYEKSAINAQNLMSVATQRINSRIEAQSESSSNPNKF